MASCETPFGLIVQNALRTADKSRPANPQAIYFQMLTGFGFLGTRLAKLPGNYGKAQKGKAIL
jgi:hypothetical protein